MAESVTPFLMFEGHAEEAMGFYASLFPHSRVVEITRYGPEGPGPEGTVQVARFEVNGQMIVCSDSPMQHDFGFTPSFSLFVTCSSAEELERLAASLGDNGRTLMPVDDYGFSRRFAWVSDRFGVSWQLNLP